MRVNNPLMYYAEMILVYKGSNQVIHNTSDRMSFQHIVLNPSIEINEGEKLEWCMQFKILDTELILVMYGQKVYEVIEQEGEKRYIHLPHSYFYFNETPEKKKIVIHGLFIYHKQYTDKCIIEERFKYQITLLKDKSISDILDTSKRLIVEEMEM